MGPLGGVAINDAFAFGVTNTVIHEVSEGHETLLPITQYLVVTIGDTFNELPTAPVLHRYDNAPLAVKVVFAPSHIVGSGEVTRDGFDNTMMVTVSLKLHRLL